MKAFEETEIVGIDECKMSEFVYNYVRLERMFDIKPHRWHRAAMWHVVSAA